MFQPKAQEGRSVTGRGSWRICLYGLVLLLSCGPSTRRLQEKHCTLVGLSILEPLRIASEVWEGMQQFARQSHCIHGTWPRYDLPSYHLSVEHSGKIIHWLHSSVVGDAVTFVQILS